MAFSKKYQISIYKILKKWYDIGIKFKKGAFYGKGENKAH